MFDFDSGALCLDFANTVEWHKSDQPKDNLKEMANLIDWGMAAKILSTEQTNQLREVVIKQPGEAAIVFNWAIQLREAIYRIFVKFSEKGRASSSDLAILNEALSDSLSHLKISPSSQGFDWKFVDSPNELGQIIWPVAYSAGELLVSDKLERVRQCADDRGCGYLFIDTSRNRSRLWCSMESCGNRAKARRHYRRQQKKKTT